MDGVVTNAGFRCLVSMLWDCDTKFESLSCFAPSPAGYGVLKSTSVAHVGIYHQACRSCLREAAMIAPSKTKITARSAWPVGGLRCFLPGYLPKKHWLCSRKRSKRSVMDPRRRVVSLQPRASEEPKQDGIDLTDGIRSSSGMRCRDRDDLQRWGTLEVPANHWWLSVPHEALIGQTQPECLTSPAAHRGAER